MFPCPCCKYLTIDSIPPGTFEICPVCFWEDDEVQYRNPDFSGGANKVSLNKARANFYSFRASSSEYLKQVRPPKTDEIPNAE